MVERVHVTAKKSEAKRESPASKARKTAYSQSLSSPANSILFLQRTIGNQAVQQLIKSGALQAKLKISQPNDIYEQEADRVAEQVMRMPESQAVSSGTLSIQRTCPGCEEEKLRRQPIEEEEEKEELLQTKEISGQNAETTPDLESRINAIRGGGQPLAESEKVFFEPRFGHDFSQVRLHTDSKAAEAARAINARAFTVGRDVVFGASQYAPKTNAGQHLIAHELTHVMQQTGNSQRAASMSSSVKIRKPGDMFEHEDDRVAVQVSSVAVQVPQCLSVSSLSIQRTCGASAIIAMTPPTCGVGDHTFVPGTLFRFNKDCDDFAPGQEATLISFASALPATATFQIHSYASVDAATFNEQLSCARSSKARLVLTAPPPSGAGIAASRITSIVDHGPTLGPAAERRSVVIRTSTPAPTPTPTPAPAFRCGPDVSSQVRAAVVKVNSTWGGWSSAQRDSACDALDARSSAAFAWDINELHNQAWILGYQPICATTGASPPCHNSVEVDGNCYYAGSANYVIFGTMCKLCNGHLGRKWHTPLLGWLRGFPEWYMQYLIALYKGGGLPWQTAAANYVPSLLWATAGYRGWPSGGTAPPGDRPGCTTGCSTAYVGPTFSIHWHPHGWF